MTDRPQPKSPPSMLVEAHKELRNRARNTDGHFSFYSIGVDRAIDHAQLWLKTRRNIEP